MPKFKKQSFYPVDLRNKIIYNVPCKTKEEIVGRSTLPLFLAKKGREINSKAFYEIDFVVKSLEDYEKILKRKKKGKKKV